MSVCPHLLLENGWTDLHEILYGYCANKQYSKFTLFNFLYSLILTPLMLKIVRWDDDDAITHEPLRMRITDLTKQQFRVTFVPAHFINTEWPDGFSWFFV
jgi:hypothetical protein